MLQIFSVGLVGLFAKEAFQRALHKGGGSLLYFLFCLDDSIGVMPLGLNVLIKGFG